MMPKGMVLGENEVQKSIAGILVLEMQGTQQFGRSRSAGRRPFGEDQDSPRLSGQSARRSDVFAAFGRRRACQHAGADGVHQLCDGLLSRAQEFVAAQALVLASNSFFVQDDGDVFGVGVQNARGEAFSSLHRLFLSKGVDVIHAKKKLWFNASGKVSKRRIENWRGEKRIKKYLFPFLFLEIQPTAAFSKDGSRLGKTRRGG